MGITFDKKEVVYYLTHRGATIISQEPVASISVIPVGEGVKRPYLALITGLKGKYGMERLFLGPYIKAENIDEGTIIEKRTCDLNVSDVHARRVQQRTFFEARDGMFHAFARVIGIIPLKPTVFKERPYYSSDERDSGHDPSDEIWDYEPKWDYS